MDDFLDGYQRPPRAAPEDPWRLLDQCQLLYEGIASVAYSSPPKARPRSPLRTDAPYAPRLDPRSPGVGHGVHDGYPWGGGSPIRGPMRSPPRYAFASSSPFRVPLDLEAQIHALQATNASLVQMVDLLQRENRIQQMQLQIERSRNAQVWANNERNRYAREWVLNGHQPPADPESTTTDIFLRLLTGSESQQRLWLVEMEGDSREVIQRCRVEVPSLWTKAPPRLPSPVSSDRTIPDPSTSCGLPPSPEGGTPVEYPVSASDDSNRTIDGTFVTPQQGYTANSTTSSTTATPSLPDECDWQDVVEAMEAEALLSCTGDGTPALNALYSAADRGKVDRVVALLRRPDVRIDDPIADGSTPLIIAAYKGHLRVVQVLLEAGADTSARTSEGLTAIDWARRKNHWDCAQVLEDVHSGEGTSS